MLQEARRRPVEGTGSRRVDGADDMDRPSDPGAASSSDLVGSVALQKRRGPDQKPRTCRTWADAGVGPEEAPDWTSFDIGRTVRALKICTPAQARLSLRKLHQRWWHAQAATMTRILKRAGVPRQVCGMIPNCQH